MIDAGWLPLIIALSGTFGFWRGQVAARKRQGIERIGPYTTIQTTGSGNHPPRPPNR